MYRGNKTAWHLMLKSVYQLVLHVSGALTLRCYMGQVKIETQQGPYRHSQLHYQNLQMRSEHFLCPRTVHRHTMASEVLGPRSATQPCCCCNWLPSMLWLFTLFTASFSAIQERNKHQTLHKSCWLDFSSRLALKTFLPFSIPLLQGAIKVTIRNVYGHFLGCHG